jgi:ParB family chromosome partitioning protein
LDDADATAISLIENVHRADMHPLDKARAFQQLNEKYTGNNERVAKETGVSVSTIRKYLALLDLPPELQDRLSTTEGPAKIDALYTLTRTFQEEEHMTQVYEQISGFTQAIQKEILKRSEGDVSRIQELVEQAMEGAFDTRMCRGLKGKMMCEYIPQELADAVIEFVEEYRTKQVPLKEMVKKLK